MVEYTRYPNPAVKLPSIELVVKQKSLSKLEQRHLLQAISFCDLTDTRALNAMYDICNDQIENQAVAFKMGLVE